MSNNMVIFVIEILETTSHPVYVEHECLIVLKINFLFFSLPLSRSNNDFRYFKGSLDAHS
jgi:hypothetical protein